MLSIVKVQEQTRIQNQGFLLRHQDMLRAMFQIQEGKQSCQMVATGLQVKWVDYSIQ